MQYFQTKRRGVHWKRNGSDKNSILNLGNLSCKNSGRPEKNILIGMKLALIAVDDGKALIKIAAEPHLKRKSVVNNEKMNKANPSAGKTKSFLPNFFTSTCPTEYANASKGTAIRNVILCIYSYCYKHMLQGISKIPQIWKMTN